MNATTISALLLTVFASALPMRWLLSGLFNNRPARFGRTYLFPDPLIDLGAWILELIKGVALLPLLEYAFDLSWILISVFIALGMAARFWIPLKSNSFAMGMLLGTLSTIHPSMMLLAIAVGLAVFSLQGKVLTACLIGVFSFPLFLWSFAPRSPYPALALGLAGLAYLKWWAQGRSEAPLVV